MDELTGIICQVWIAAFGCSAIWCVGRLERWARWGYIFGLISQPAWMFSAYTHKQWGIFALTLFYTYSWGQGVYNHWIKARGIDG